jgi:hypothetical protein
MFLLFCSCENSRGSGGADFVRGIQAEHLLLVGGGGNGRVQQAHEDPVRIRRVLQQRDSQLETALHYMTTSTDVTKRCDLLKTRT